MPRVASTLEAEGAQAVVSMCMICPLHGGLPDFSIRMLNLRPGPTDGTRDPKENWEEVEFPNRVIGEAEHTPFGSYGDTGEDRWFKGTEKSIFAKTSDLAVHEDSPLFCRGLTAK